MPQSPQLSGSLDGSTQLEPHWVLPEGQLLAHAPPVQTWPVGQLTAQSPQLAPSPWRLTHAPLQLVRSAWHSQVPLAQYWPAAHTTPHAPQFCASLVTSRHCPPHASWPAGQAQTPALQL